ncbi:hypothetical protein [Bradyrhizobium ivorense]|uniref:hypothetical protein n=1 Tax=Bradyrhizobium ivorense TaxID=2511166 RepID=UPI0010B55E17|nr:hypothetical protein [Bradyrhizobium ivorense]VIO73879.1 hypothetical protein CI41S_39880 [Bradyrhizobium ivorense]
MALDQPLFGFFKFCELSIREDLTDCDRQIREALWQKPADMDRAKVLISKRMGLRIVLGERKVRLKKPIVHIIDDSEALAA